jgi:hypothetical protein
MAESWTGGRKRERGSSVLGSARYPGRKTPLYVDFWIRVWVVSPYVRMVARRTVPCESEMSWGGAMETAPDVMAAAYMASRLSTSKATSGRG